MFYGLFILSIIINHVFPVYILMNNNEKFVFGW